MAKEKASTVVNFLTFKPLLEDQTKNVHMCNKHDLVPGNQMVKHLVFRPWPENCTFHNWTVNYSILDPTLSSVCQQENLFFVAIELKAARVQFTGRALYAPCT